MVLEWTFFLSGFVNRRKIREWQRFSLSKMQRKKGWKRIILKWLLKWKTNSNSRSSILHAQTRCKSVHARGFTAGQKKIGKQGPRSHQTSMPDRQATGRWAVGRWAAVLLLAKPSVPLLLLLFLCIFFSQIKSFSDCYWCLYSRIKETLRCIIKAFTRSVKHSKDALLIPLLLVKVKMRLR